MTAVVEAYLTGWRDAQRTFLESMSYATDDAVVFVVRERQRDLGIPDWRTDS